MRTWIATAMMLLGGIGAHAQATMTVSPITTQCGKRCVAAYHLVDDSNYPMSYAITAYAMTFSKEIQGPSISKLDEAAIKLRLSTMSGRLSPHESREINFKFECPQGDCQIMFSNRMGVIGHKGDTQNIRVVLPHVVYSCVDGGRNCRDKTLAAANQVKPEDRK